MIAALLALLAAGAPMTGAPAPVLVAITDPVVKPETWTVDQIRFVAPKDLAPLKALEGDHSLNAVAARLRKIGIMFERSTVKVHTRDLPAKVVDAVNKMAPTEPWLFPFGNRVTINVILNRKPGQ